MHGYGNPLFTIVTIISTSYGASVLTITLSLGATRCLLVLLKLLTLLDLCNKAIEESALFRALDYTVR